MVSTITGLLLRPLLLVKSVQGREEEEKKKEEEEEEELQRHDDSVMLHGSLAEFWERLGAFWRRDHQLPSGSARAGVTQERGGVSADRRCV